METKIVFGLKPKTIGLLIALGAAIANGLWPAAGRGVFAAGGNYVFLLIFTIWIRAAAMAAFLIAIRRPLFATKTNLKEGIIGGFFQFLALFGLYKALEYLPGPIVIIILFTHSLLLLFFMAWRKEIKLTAATVMTTVVALAGLTFVIDLWDVHSSQSWLGIALAFGAAFASVGRLYVWNQLTQKHHPIVVGAECFIFAAIFSLSILFFEPMHFPITMMGWDFFWMCTIALVIGAFGIFYGISLIGSFEWSLFSKLEPVFTAIFSALLIHEILKPSQYWGIVIVAGSLVAYQLLVKKQKNPVVSKWNKKPVTN